MAKYDITYACGHTASVALWGNLTEREKKIQYYQTQVCPDCKKAANKIEYAEATQKAKDIQLPDLEGSKDQIGWANVIRVDAFDRFEDARTLLAEKQPALLPCYEQFINDFKAHTQATYWIVEYLKYQKQDDILLEFYRFYKRVNKIEEPEKPEQQTAGPDIWPYPRYKREKS